MRIEVVSKDMGARENGAKAQVIAYTSKNQTAKNIYELGDHVGEEALSSNLWPKLRPTKKTPPISYPNHLLKNV